MLSSDRAVSLSVSRAFAGLKAMSRVPMAVAMRSHATVFARKFIEVLL